MTGLVVDPDLEIVSHNSTEIVSAAVGARSLKHTFSPLRISDEDQYTCTATVSIPQAGITDLHSSATSTLSVVCKL